MKIPSVIAIAVLLAGASILSAATVTLTEASDPPGFVDQTTNVESATEVATVAAPLESNSFRFTHWDLNGVRQEDATGRAMNKVTFTILENTTATAHYLPADADSDTDGVPDWFEVMFYGNLGNSALSDTDGDGLTLLDEYERDLHPRLRNEVRDGGVSRAGSATVFAIFDPGFFHYVESSDPPGFLDSRQIVASGEVVTTPNLHGESQGYIFGYFTVNGVRQGDATGRALSQVEVTVTADTEVVAYYFPSGDDTDGDGVPDWFEWQFYPNLANNGDSDSDGDGLKLAEEYERDLHPGLVNDVRDGGLSRASSELVDFSLEGFVRYTISSDPLGFIPEESGVAEEGTVITSPSLHGETNGHYFTCWTVNGVRQTDSLGLPVDQVSVTLLWDDAYTGTTLVANFLPAVIDSDVDGVPDWFEQYYYGDLSQGEASDSDGDGLTLFQEYERDLNPLLGNEVRDGGVSRASGDLISVNLQPFERLRFALVASVLTEVFSEDPQVVTGWDFGDHAAPALGDWDSDGDYDLIVCASDGLSVYENIGTPFTMNLADRSANFAGLSALCAGIDTPRPSMGDWNQDGNEDLAIGGETGVIQLGASTGNFDSSQPSVSDLLVDTGSTRALPAFGDINGDSMADLLVVLGDGSVRLYPHSGNNAEPYSAFSDNILVQSIPNATGISCADINADGLTDVVVADNEGRLWEFHALSGGGFFLKSKVWGGGGNGFASGLGISVRDIDGDEDADLVGGTSAGAVIGLRDPRLGRPTSLKAVSGPRSVLLTWDPNQQSRIKGYYIYRAESVDGPFVKLNATPEPDPQYLDSNIAPGRVYYYRVTSVTESFLPGNTVPRVVESDPSEIVSSRGGLACLVIRPARAKPGKDLKIRIAIENSVELSGTGLEIRIGYDPALFTPRGQVDPSKPTVKDSGLTRNLSFSDNGLTANGEIIITGSGGTAREGRGTLFTIYLRVNDGVPGGTNSDVMITSAILQDTAGNGLDTACSTDGPVVVSNGFEDGDLTGDGIVNDDDEDLLKDLLKKNSRPPTTDELAAGDLNGNGELDNGDRVLLKRLLLGLPTTP